MQKLTAILLVCINIFAVQIKDVASIVGVRDNQLIGYGLVVGLNGSGDGSTSEFTIQSLSNMLQTMDVKVSPDDIKSKNVAAVIVTAKLPAFARQGDKLDVSISSIGDAKSLTGGTLLMTPLKAVDGDIYAIAQGAVSIGGKGGGRGDGNHPTVATLPGGANVEREVTYDFYNQQGMTLSLNNVSFDTAIKIEHAINTNLSYDMARAIDPKTVLVRRVDGMNLIELASKILSLDIDYAADDKIVIDERTGTIVSGVNVEVSPVVLTHKDITIKIEPNFDGNVGENDISLGSDAAISPNEASIKVRGAKANIAGLTRALTKLGASASDIITIIENLKRVGAINVPVEII